MAFLSNGRMERRAFLQGGLATLAGASLLSPVQACAATPLFATVIDVDACTGCGECVRVCRKRAATIVPTLSSEQRERVKRRDWSKEQWRNVQDRLTPYTWLVVQKIQLPEKDGAEIVYMPRRCMHCLHPSCMWLCPTGALCQEACGAVILEQKLCIGDGKCIRHCPWHFPMLQAGLETFCLPQTGLSGCVFKCDLCFDLLQQGPPLCVKSCPKQAMHFGPYDQMVQLARTLSHARGVQEIFGLEENGGTTTLYVSKHSIRSLEIGLLQQKGLRPGLPTLRTQSSPRKMIDPLSLLVGAPLAGAAVACLRLFRDRQMGKKS